MSLASDSFVADAGVNGAVMAVLVLLYAEFIAAPIDANWFFIDWVVEDREELAVEGVEGLEGFQIGFFQPVCVHPVAVAARTRHPRSERILRFF